MSCEQIPNEISTTCGEMLHKEFRDRNGRRIQLVCYCPLGKEQAVNEAGIKYCKPNSDNEVAESKKLIDLCEPSRENHLRCGVRTCRRSFDENFYPVSNEHCSMILIVSFLNIRNSSVRVLPGNR